MKINSEKRGGYPPLRTDSVHRFLAPSLIQRLQQLFMLKLDFLCWKVKVIILVT